MEQVEDKGKAKEVSNTTYPNLEESLKNREVPYTFVWKILTYKREKGIAFIMANKSSFPDNDFCNKHGWILTEPLNIVKHNVILCRPVETLLKVIGFPKIKTLEGEAALEVLDFPKVENSEN